MKIFNSTLLTRVWKAEMNETDGNYFFNTQNVQSRFESNKQSATLVLHTIMRYLTWHRGAYPCKVSLFVRPARVRPTL